ncbi:TetR/AcrR family transcriptional regulator [Aureimonas psammosilenae]|uniref:TetR/AcrR family transcriptional regulator n=1 Tax=Aureimonas psammosilenae TaxID=2495496 RepID=UPI00186A8BBD|nr:helix-turn-helix domain-containing protein [Aureimonas psammosilenae]
MGKAERHAKGGGQASARRASFAGGRLERLSPAGETSRATLLRAAAECFGETGYRQASIHAVARRCGATKGLVYHHYRSKGDLYLDAMRWGLNHLESAIQPVFASRERAATRLKGMATSHLAALLAEPAARHARRGNPPSDLGPDLEEEAAAITGFSLRYDGLFGAVLDDARREGDADTRLPAGTTLPALLAVLDLPARSREPFAPADLALAALRAAGLQPAVLDEEFA